MWSADDVQFKLKVYLWVCWDFCLSLKIINKKEEEEEEEEEKKKTKKKNE